LLKLQVNILPTRAPEFLSPHFGLPTQRTNKKLRTMSLPSSNIAPQYPADHQQWSTFGTSKSCNPISRSKEERLILSKEWGALQGSDEPAAFRQNFLAVLE